MGRLVLSACTRDPAGCVGRAPDTLGPLHARDSRDDQAWRCPFIVAVHGAGLGQRTQMIVSLRLSRCLTTPFVSGARFSAPLNTTATFILAPDIKPTAWARRSPNASTWNPAAPGTPLSCSSEERAVVSSGRH